MSADAPHFRIVYPADLKGHKHRAGSGVCYMTLPGSDVEIRLPNLSLIAPQLPVDGAMAIDLTFMGSVEIQYQDEPEHVDQFIINTPGGGA